MEKGGLMPDFVVRFAYFIVIVVIIVVILLVILGPKLRGAIDDLACENSIQKRAKYNLGPFEVGRNIIPLSGCETNLVCISFSGGKCEDIFDSDDVEELKVSKDPEKAKEEVLNFITKEKVRITRMTGSGLNFMPRKIWDENYCPIFTWYALDEEVRGKIPDPTYGKLYEYMDEQRVEGTSALSYVYPGWESPETARVLFEHMKEENEQFKNMDYNDWKININHHNGNVIIVQLHNVGLWEQYAATGLVAGGIIVGTGFAIFTGGASLSAIPFAIGIAAVGVGGAVVAGGVTYVLTTPDKTAHYIAPQVHPHDLESLQELKCTDFKIAP